jgi:hypothetical protein
MAPDDSPEFPPRGHGIDVLGTSDTSDSGSDVAGAGEPDTADPNEPVDVGTRDDSGRATLPTESFDSDTDSSGTGERGSAAGDSGESDEREAFDISTDRIVDARSAGVDDSDEIDESDGIASDDPRDKRQR